ncbi:MAG: SMI1/KNR4 family protein [Candidatus Woesearchaeota archaeon]|nr:SMI1/KNR4 family protein [Candidatus Woesearchaeota archaeon]
MAKSDTYHKVHIDELLRELEKAQEQNPDPDTGVKLYPAATLGEITQFESMAGKLPDDYRSFLLYSNGANVFGVTLNNISDLERTPFIYMHGEKSREAMDVYAIAHWDTGDQILLNLKAPAGAKDPNRRDIIDRFHESDECRVIAKSFGEFLYRIIEGSKIQDETFDNALYWLNGEFKPYRELQVEEFNDD